MAKIERFEDIESWRLAREVTKLLATSRRLAGFMRYLRQNYKAASFAPANLEL